MEMETPLLSTRTDLPSLPAKTHTRRQPAFARASAATRKTVQRKGAPSAKKPAESAAHSPLEMPPVTALQLPTTMPRSWTSPCSSMRPRGPDLCLPTTASHGVETVTLVMTQLVDTMMLETF